MFSLAHLSDPHLPLPGATLRELTGKRITGYLSWITKRQDVYRPEIRQVLINDLKKQSVDHIACTGDLINVSAKAEYGPATAFLRDLGSEKNVSLVPGNHDYYVPHSLYPQAWLGYMQGGVFPYKRLFGDIAVIGLSSACPTPPFSAAGRLGEVQLAALREELNRLQGYFRVILIHHPPFGERRFPRKALKDAEDFRKVIAGVGAELVLHGHIHRTSVEEIKRPNGGCPVIGVASASARTSRHSDPASYHLYRIEKNDEHWLIHMDIRRSSQGHTITSSAGRFLFKVQRN